MAQMKWKRCKLHRCYPKKPEHEYELSHIYGDCLEEVGIPNKGQVLINRTIEPKVGDLVHCNNYMCTLNGFIKQVKSIDGDEMIVQTRYRDKSKDFEFYVCEFYGVVEMVFDSMGNLCYKRPMYFQDIRTTTSVEFERHYLGKWYTDEKNTQ
jgi:hypothetical protein